MGIYDSSLTRVAPFFDALMHDDETGKAWLSKLLSLPQHGSGALTPSETGKLTEVGRWGARERKLQPPLSLLSWLVRNLNLTTRCTAKWPEREELKAQNPARIEEALQLLRGQRHAASEWYVLEGPSRPDAYLATDQIVVVIEGKRTESGPTNSTTWMKGRRQMLRHLDAAYEIKGRRALFGFFIVEGEPAGNLSKEWVQTCTDTISDEAISESLPHRPESEREEITNAFLGATTWRQACKFFDINPGSLPHTVSEPHKEPLVQS